MTEHFKKRPFMREAGAGALLKAHRLHMGVYARVATKLGVDASYVSRVANGKRGSEKIMRAILAELAAIDRRRGSV
jgi:transcriptional regulator with XRE-family HTH domain